MGLESLFGLNALPGKDQYVMSIRYPEQVFVVCLKVSPGEFLTHLKEINPEVPFRGGTTHVNIELLIRAFGAVNADTMVSGL